MSSGIKKGIVIIFIANLINLSLSLIRNFLLPKYLPFDTYADIKTYQLYTSYAGFLGLGYIDGMYLKYGGKSFKQIDYSDFSVSISTFRLMELLICGILAGIGIVKQDTIFITMSISILFLNIVDFYKCFFQAIGEFSIYSRVLNVSSLLLFSVNMLLLFVSKKYDSAPYVWAYSIIYFGMWIVVELYFSRKTHAKSVFTIFSIDKLQEYISTGFVLMMGLFISGFMTGIDRWFVKFTMDTVAFAKYSFAASILGFLSYAVSPVSVTLYNYFCKNKNIKQRAFSKGVICVFASYIVACAFPVKLILEVYLTEYKTATPIIFILFASQILFTVIKCFYVNIYKSESLQSLFLKRMIEVLVAGIIFNICLFAIFRNELAYAFGTLFSALLWYALCTKDIEIGLDITRFVYMLTTIIIFIVFGIVLKSYIGFVAYCFCTIILSALIMKKETLFLVTSVLNIIKKRI